MKRIIKWHSQHLEIDVLSGKLNEFEEDFDDGDLEEEEYMDSEQMNVQNVMSTPFGLWRVDDSMHPYKQFQLWMGYTNFSINQNVVNTIKTTPGVEVLQVMTRYRFIMGVGELFNIHDVRTSIEKALLCNKDEKEMIENKEILKKIDMLKKDLSTYNQWAIYVFPNGNIDFTTSDKKDFFSERNTFRQAVDYSSGVLIESE